MRRIVQCAGVVCVGLAAAAACGPAPAAEAAGDAAKASARAALLQTTCAEIAGAARAFGLPEHFLIRLIWRESRFNPQAVSSAGAQGIAQFMPGTAQWRGLDDPFDGALAIRHSGRWLGELRRQFGNLGLAAAAYNAGPGRVQEWLSGARALPEETRAYVRGVTGRSAEDWVGMRDDGGESTPQAECPPRGAVVALGAAPGGAKPAAARSGRGNPWALQLVGDRSKSAALEQYADMRRRFAAILGPRPPEVAPRRIGGRLPTYWYQVRVSEASRQSATSLCERLKSAGGQCLVIRN